MIEIDDDIAAIIAHLPGVRGAVAAEAEDLGARAEANLSGHRETGSSSIEVEHGELDSFVTLVDEAAEPIEFGHLTRPGEDAHRVFVPGLRILRDAAGL